MSNLIASDQENNSIIEEIWKDVKGYEGLYSVSNLGRIKSYLLFQGTGTRERIRVLSLASAGYPCLCLQKNGKQSTFLVHRLVAQAFIPNPLNLPQVNHIDSNKKNNNVDNLEWVTHQKNIDHASANNRIARGIRKWNSKLSEQDVIEVLKMLELGIKTPTIAKRFSVSDVLISRIKLGRAWRHITKKIKPPKTKNRRQVFDVS